MAEVRWSQRARDDLRRIHDFIASDSPRAADTVTERVLYATERLASFPESGRPVAERQDPSYREVIVGNYRAVYRVSGAVVRISAVVHARRLIERGSLDH